MNNMLDYDLNGLKKWMTENGESAFRAKQVLDWIYKGVWDFDHMKNIPSGTKEKLKECFCVDVPIVVELLKSQSDETHKMLLKYRDGNVIESVIMKYKHGNTICVSTQIGCRMGCSFCASTVSGMVRNLTAGEIIGQILRGQQVLGERISNVVLMGSGEPLDNFDNVIEFFDLVNAEYGLNIGSRHMTLSTCGIVPKIIELADMQLQITLAISLHATNDELRRNVMPVANKYPLEELLEACKYYIDKTNKRVTFEYALIKDVNDTLENARELCKLLKGMLCHVNLIPVNAVRENDYRKSEQKSIMRFKETLERAGISTTVRREMGSDINAACGQLRRSYMEQNNKGV